jgi:transcriptional regulator with XRE-family HTH domain
MFNDWLLSQLNQAQWSQADLARASGLTTAAISKYMGGRIPDKVALRKIAKAFKLPPETVFRAAGALPSIVEDPWVSEMEYKISQLTGMRREMAEQLLNSLLDQQAREEKSSPKTNPSKS